MTTIAVRSASTRRSVCRSAGSTATSSAAIGSSSSSRRGSAASARATATRWACPPESCDGRAPASSPTPTSSSQRWASARAVGARRTGAAWPEGDVLEGVEVREEQRLLAEQGGTSGVRWHPDARPPGPTSVSTRPSSTTRPVSGATRPAMHAERASTCRSRWGRAAARVSPVGDLDGHVDVALGDGELEHEGHSDAPALPGEPDDQHRDDDQQHERQRDRGVGVGLALEVDLQRQRAGPALEAAGEGDRRAELAQRAGERQHRARDQPGQHQRQRDPAEHRRRAGAERRGHDLVALTRRCAAPPRATDDEERQRHERLRHHHRDRRERDLDAERVERSTEQPAPAEGVEQREPADDRRQHQRQQHQRPQHARARGSRGAPAPAPSARRTRCRATVLAADVRRLSQNAARESSDVISVPKFGQSTLRDDRDEREQHERRPDEGRDVDPPGQPDRCAGAGRPVPAGHGLREAGLLEDATARCR